MNFLRKHLPWIALVGGLLAIVVSILPRPNPGSLDIHGFGRLPVLEGGRLKPLDTVARTSLLQIQNRQAVYLDDGSELEPIEWLLDVIYRPAKAQAYRIFVIDNPELLSLIGQTDETLARHYSSSAAQTMAVIGFLPSRWRRFSYHDVEPFLQKIEDQAKIALPVDDRLRSPFQGGVVRLYQNLILYQRLQNAVQVPGADDFLDEMERFEKAIPEGVAAIRAKEAKQPHDEAAAQGMMKLGERYLRMADASSLLLIPPAESAGALIGWQTAGQSLLGAFQTGHIAVAELAYAALGKTWRDQQPEQFNTIIAKFSADLSGAIGAPLKKVHAEVRFNAAEPFYTGMPLYCCAFILAIFSWVWLGWSSALQGAAVRLVAVAWALTPRACSLGCTWRAGRR
jgi:hypothetical protein